MIDVAARVVAVMVTYAASSWMTMANPAATVLRLCIVLAADGATRDALERRRLRDTPPAHGAWVLRAAADAAASLTLLTLLYASTCMRKASSIMCSVILSACSVLLVISLVRLLPVVAAVGHHASFSSDAERDALAQDASLKFERGGYRAMRVGAIAWAFLLT